MYALKTRAINRINGPNGNFSEQHANSLTELFGEYMNVALRQVLLKVKRKVLLEQLENGTIDCLIGTHARFKMM